MLKVKIEENEINIETNGSLTEILADISVVVRTVYTQLDGANHKLASAFRENLVRAISNPDSPVWDPITKGTRGPEDVKFTTEDIAKLMRAGVPADAIADLMKEGGRA